MISETSIIWTVTILAVMLIVVPYYLKYRKTQRIDRERRAEAVRLGADKAIAQHPQIDAYTCIGCGACVAACPEGDVLGLVAGKATIINGLKCVGHGKCAEACPVEGITIGLGNVKGRDDIPFMTDNYETNISGLYIAGELGGLALIKNAIAQGRQIVNHIAESPQNTSNSSIYDIIIAGAGPAGLSAALAAKQHNLNFLLLDQEDAGGTILHYPRKKVVMTKPVEIPLYGWLDRAEYSKEELLAIWEEIKNRFELQINSYEKLVDIKKQDDLFSVITARDTYTAGKVVLALGRGGTPRKLGITGENRAKVMYNLIDAENYQNEHILVVGGGDSAIEAAIGLALQRDNTVTLSYRKEKFFRIKQRNQERIEKLRNENKISIEFESQVDAIGEDHVILNSRNEKKTIANSYVFIFAGGEPPYGMLKKIGIRFGQE
jgi:thioredoxin reductase (NADPH)